MAKRSDHPVRDALGTFDYNLLNRSKTYPELLSMWERAVNAKDPTMRDVAAARGMLADMREELLSESLTLKGGMREVTLRWKLPHDEWQRQFELMTGAKKQIRDVTEDDEEV